MIICGVQDNKLRERLLREATLGLEKAIQLGQAAEETKKHVQQLKSETEHSVYKIQKSQEGQQKTNNKYCSYNHARGRCPAYGKKCKNCNKPNHFANCCFTRRNADSVEVRIQDNESNQSK